MKPHSPELRALFLTRQFYAADLWTITLAAGTVLRYCGGDKDITANGFLYSAGGQIGPYFDRTDNKAKCHWKVGVEVDTLTVDAIPAGALVNGAPFLQCIRQGVFDAAEVMLEKAYMPTYGDTRCGVLRYFVGRVGEIDAGRSIATFNILSHLELLNLSLPRNVVQPPCMNNLGDSMCTVNINSFKTTGTISSGSTDAVLNASLSGSFATGTFDQGKVVFSSGALSGFQATVKTCTFGTPDVITLVGPLPVTPGLGDAFAIYYGCNHSYTDVNGCPKFSNVVHFRGFSFVPQPTVAV